MTFPRRVPVVLWSLLLLIGSALIAQEPVSESESSAAPAAAVDERSVERRLEQIEQEVRRLAEEEAELKAEAQRAAALAAERAADEESQLEVRAAEARAEEAAEAEDEDKDEEDRREVRRRRGRTDRKVSVGDRIRVKKGETVSEIVAVGTKVDVDGEVEGNVTVWGGDIVIDGEVGGDIKAFGGDIKLEDDADVLGHVTSFGGNINQHPEASILGSVSEVSVGSSLTPGFNREPKERAYSGDDDLKDRLRRRRSRVVRWDELFEFAWWCVGLAVIFLLGAFTMLVAPAAMDRMARIVNTDLWKAGLVGLAVAVMSLPVFAILCVILMVTLIGIPLIPVLAFAYALAAFLGVMTSCYALGRMVNRSQEDSSRYWALGIGFLLVLLPLILSEAMDFLSFLQPMSVLFWIFGWMVLFIAGVVGVGALLLTSFGARNPGSFRSGSGFVPPPPPPPPPPGSSGSYQEPLEGELLDPDEWQPDAGEMSDDFDSEAAYEDDGSTGYDDDPLVEPTYEDQDPGTESDEEEGDPKDKFVD